MVCKKCGYQDRKEKKIFGSILCSFCSFFAPEQLTEFQQYTTEKTDWKTLEPYRKYQEPKGKKQQEGMTKKASKGKTMTRAPWGYTNNKGTLQQNEEASSVHSLFRTFINKRYSLNTLAKQYGLSTNGLKKVLTNRTYLGEIKFSGRIYQGKHQPIITPDVYYAAQRKLEQYKKTKKE